jgi:hypothetical protein
VKERAGLNWLRVEPNCKFCEHDDKLSYSASCPMGTGGFYSGVKRLGVKLTTHLLVVPRSTMRGAIPPSPQYVFMAWR